MSEPERPTLAEVVADLEATVALVLGGVKGDTDSGVVVPIWQLQALLDAAREVDARAALLRRVTDAWVDAMHEVARTLDPEERRTQDEDGYPGGAAT